MCKDIFGPGRDKKEFLIFDWCDNIDYFEEHYEDHVATETKSLTERIFNVRTDIAYCLQASQYQTDEFAKNFHDELKATLVEQVKALPDSHISVRKHWATVKRFSNSDAWLCLRATDTLELKNNLGNLVTPPAHCEGNGNNEDVKALKFDLLSLYIQLGLVDDTFESKNAEATITRIVDKLRQRASHPQIRAKLPLLNEIMNPTFWDN